MNSEIETEYSAAKDEYERAETAFRVAATRLRDASRAMNREFDKLWNESAKRTA